jgi:hypothetical protein
MGTHRRLAGPVGRRSFHVFTEESAIRTRCVAACIAQARVTRPIVNSKFCSKLPWYAFRRE